MKPTFEILKSRWQEVVALFALWISISWIENTGSATTGSGHQPWNLASLFFPIVFCGSFLASVLSCGFVRLACVQGQEHQSLQSLWKAGIHFFWRMLGYACLLGVAVLVVVVLTRKALIPHCFPSITDGLNARALTYCLPGIVLMKPLMYMPAIIISKDCGIRAAWNQMWCFRILAAPQLLVLFLLHQFLQVGMHFNPQFSTWHPAMQTLMGVLSNFLTFLLLLEGTRVAGWAPKTLESSSTVAA